MEEKREEYYIPTNYNNSGRYLMGLTSGRNLLEMLIVLVPLCVIVYPLLTSKLVIIPIIILVGAPLAMGIDGGSVGQYLYRIGVFLFAKKKYSLDAIGKPAETVEDKAAAKKESGKLKDRLVDNLIAKLEKIRSKNTDAEKEESKND